MLQIDRATQFRMIPGHDWLGGEPVVGQNRLMVPMLLAIGSSSPCSGVRVLDQYILTVSTAHCPDMSGGQAWTSPRELDFNAAAGLDLIASNAGFDLSLYRTQLSLPGRKIAALFPDELRLFGWGSGHALEYARFRALPDCGRAGLRRVERASSYTYTEDGDSGGPAIDPEGRICGLILGSKKGVVDLVDLTHPEVRDWLISCGMPTEAFAI